jgi:hypothetical protein
MKYVRTGEYQENALDRLDKFKALDILNKGLLKRIDTLLNMLLERYPDDLNTFLTNIITSYESLLEHVSLLPDNVPDVNLEDKLMLLKYPELSKKIVTYYVHLLQNSESLELITNEFTTSQRNHFRSFLLPRYQNLQALIKTLGRKEAIKLYKRYTSFFYTQLGKPEKHNFVNLQRLYEKVSKQTSPPSDWVIVRGLMENGKYFYLNKNCLWVEALPDIKDEELVYLICCYGDYQNAQRYYNPHIILTMEHTIAQGDPYCSRVLHDTQEDWDLRHPEKAFWDELHKE